MAPVVIRGFTASDRQRVRQICCETTFLGVPRQRIFSDDDILADVLTVYYTDYEPQSCFVACDGSRVVGYIIGSCAARRMDRIFMRQILPGIFKEAVKRNVLFRSVHIKFFGHCLSSLVRGEFVMPDFSKEFPAVLHINIDADYRGRGIGSRLMAAYLSYLKGARVRGVHCGTLSEESGAFFATMGFVRLYEGRRSYLQPYAGKPVPYFIYGRLVE